MNGIDAMKKVINDCKNRAKDKFYENYPESLKDDIEMKKNAERILKKLKKLKKGE